MGYLYLLTQSKPFPPYTLPATPLAHGIPRRRKIDKSISPFHSFNVVISAFSTPHVQQVSTLTSASGCIAAGSLRTTLTISIAGRHGRAQACPPIFPAPEPVFYHLDKTYLFSGVTRHLLGAEATKCDPGPPLGWGAPPSSQ